MTIQNISNEFLWIPHRQFRYGVGPGEWLVLTSHDPDDNREIGELIKQHKVAVVADTDFENYTFNESEPEAAELDTTEVEDSFRNIRFKD